MREDGGAGRDALGRAFDSLFDENAVGRTSALLVMKRGSVIAQRYGDGVDSKTPLPGWSMAQCVTGLMIGQLVSDGRLRLDETAPVPTWQRPGDPRGEITLRQLLQQRSGLRHSETAPEAARADRYRMLFLDGRDDMAAYAEAQPLESVAGRSFEPSAANFVILADIAARVLSESPDAPGRRVAVQDFLRTRVLDPIGMRTTQVGFDAAGTFVGSSYVAASAQDWGLLAEFLRQHGSVRGAQVIPRRWVEFMRTQSPRQPGYGAALWLTSARAGPAARLLGGDLAPESFACRGEGGQVAFGSPRQLLTVVRLGSTPAEKEDELERRLGAMVRLFPGGGRSD